MTNRLLRSSSIDMAHVGGIGAPLWPVRHIEETFLGSASFATCGD
jgi:hypothetical protein